MGKRDTIYVDRDAQGRWFVRIVGEQPIQCATQGEAKAKAKALRKEREARAQHAIHDFDREVP